MSFGKFYLVVCGFIISTSVSFGQKETYFKKDYQIKKLRLTPGFNYHLQISQLDISPYMLLKNRHRLHPGLGLNYLYYYRNQRKGTCSYGLNLFARYFYYKNLFIHAETLFCNVSDINESNREKFRTNKTDLFLGAGYSQPISDKVNSYLTISVNINNTSISAYQNLILFKAGFSF